MKLLLQLLLYKNNPTERGEEQRDWPNIADKYLIYCLQCNETIQLIRENVINSSPPALQPTNHHHNHIHSTRVAQYQLRTGFTTAAGQQLQSEVHPVVRVDENL